MLHLGSTDLRTALPMDCRHRGNRAVAEVEVLAEAGVDLVEDPVLVGAVRRDHVGGDHGQAGRDQPGVQVVHPDHARHRHDPVAAGSERPRGVDSMSNVHRVAQEQEGRRSPACGAHVPATQHAGILVS